MHINIHTRSSLHGGQMLQFLNLILIQTEKFYYHQLVIFNAATFKAGDGKLGLVMSTLSYS